MSSDEDAVGIRAFTTTTGPISCVFRERIRDFIVHEIDVDGEVAKLTPFAVPVTKHDSALEDLAAELGTDALDDFVVSIDDPGKRKRIHDLVAQTDTLISDERGDQLRISTKAWGAKKKKKRKKKRPMVRFAVFKENADTMQVAKQIARVLKVKHVGYAGTKDKRAATTQWMTAEVDPADLKECEGQRWRIGNIRLDEKGLELGDLRGNRFDVALRCCEGLSVDTAKAACTAVQDVGFCNYFGLQRFGAAGTNAAVGKKLLQGDWKGTVDAILSINSNDDAATRNAKRLYLEQGKALDAANGLPKQLNIERSLLYALAEKNDDYLAAIRTLPKNHRLLYVHAYQSMTWNLAATKRLERHGLNVVPGDLVLQDPVTSSRDLAATAHVHLVTSDPTKYRLDDVVLPLPGANVQYPTFDGAEPVYKDKAISSSSSSDNLFGGTLTGAYRKLLVKPLNLTWRLVPYSSKHDQLIDTDVDLLSSDQTEPPAKKPRLDENNKRTALVVGFDLPASSYATICLREMTKSSMAKNIHQAREAAYYGPSSSQSEPQPPPLERTSLLRGCRVM